MTIGEQLSAENRLQIVQTKSSASSPEEKAAENPMYEDIAKKQPSEQAQNDASLYGSAEPYVQIPGEKYCNHSFSYFSQLKMQLYVVGQSPCRAAAPAVTLVVH